MGSMGGNPRGGEKGEEKKGRQEELDTKSYKEDKKTPNGTRGAK